MSNSNRQASVSPDERRQAKSRSSSRSQRISSTKTDNEEDRRRAKTASSKPKRNTRDTHSSKTSDGSPSNRSTNPSSPRSKKQKSNTKTPSTSGKSKSPSSSRKKTTKRKKPWTKTNDNDNTQAAPVNDSENQDLSLRGLSTIPHEILELVTLRRLVLSNNNISLLPSSIRSLVNLEYLDISRNPLRVKNGLDDYTCLPREFRHLRNLHTLLMAECTLKHIPAVVWHLANLEVLDLSRNKVGYIVSEIGNLLNLQHLRLSQMDLDTLPPEIGFCEKLQTIDLTSNPIDNLPETLVECRLLYEFKINYQTFHKLLDSYMLQLIDEGKIRSEHVPQVVFELESLEILDLNHTKLNSIPTQHTLVNLHELYISNNSFFEIPESLCTMRHLKILDMSNNRLETIPEYIVQIEQLETLILAHNRLSVLPSHLAKLSTLKALLVSNNQINTIEAGFSQTQSLLTLDISSNNINRFPIELCNFKQLETLDLRYNQIDHLPLSIRQMTGLKSMNLLDGHFQRVGLHLVGNPIHDPPSYIWKSTVIQTLFDYLEKKEKQLLNHFYHLKLILIGPKKIGKTTLMLKLLNNTDIVSRTQKTLDMYLSILQENQLNQVDQSLKQKRLSDVSSIMTDHWIENRISTSTESSLTVMGKVKRQFPPPLHTYRSNESLENFLHKATFITKNNFYFTIFDIKSEPSFEILYPLIYDTTALFIVPVNLTYLTFPIQTTNNAEETIENDNQISVPDYDRLLTNEWLYENVFRYIESISDHCQQVSIAIIGLIMNENRKESNESHQQLLDEIHSKVNMFLTDEESQRHNVQLYSELFSEPIYLEDDRTSDQLIGILEDIAEQSNFKHHKAKRQVLKRCLGFMEQNSLIIGYDTCLEHFEQQKESISISSDIKDRESLEQEINEMTFETCLDYLKLTGDILSFERNCQKKILIKPYYILNNILSRTLFRPNMSEWLNYDENMVFHFSGYYLTENSFNIDRDRLLTRGEYTWKMLNVLLYEQNNSNVCYTEQNIIDYCHLMEYLYLGYLNEPNLNYREFTTPCFVCPWFIQERSMKINYKDYFKALEQRRLHEKLQRDQKRKFKQQQIWLAMDHDQQYILRQQLSNEKTDFSAEYFHIKTEELPPVEEIEVAESQIIDQDPIRMIKIFNKSSKFLPYGLYERLLICLHPLLDERLDYYNITLARTIDRKLIQTQRSDTHSEISLTINNCLVELLQDHLKCNLFSFYPTADLQIET